MFHNKGKKIIVHCTCTGWGGFLLEPNVPDYKVQLDNLKALIDMGFPAGQCVLRVDPIFPSENGLKRANNVIRQFGLLDTGISRIRISVADEYRHVKERYRKRGWPTLYGNSFSASQEQFKAVADLLNKHDYTFEVCAENYLSKLLNKAAVIGCISTADLDILGIPYDGEMCLNPQNRSGCHCLACKTELLTARKQCPNGCVYCFWK